MGPIIKGNGGPRLHCLDRANGRGGLGSQTAADPPPATPGEPEKQTVGAVTAPGAPSMPSLQRQAAWAEESLLGDLRQPVPETGRIHLHIIDL